MGLASQKYMYLFVNFCEDEIMAKTIAYLLNQQCADAHHGSMTSIDHTVHCFCQFLDS